MPFTVFFLGVMVSALALDVGVTFMTESLRTHYLELS